MTGTPPPPPPPAGRNPLSGGPPPPPGAGPPVPLSAPGFSSASSSGTNGMAIASLVLGILSIPLCFIFIPAILGVVFGIIALSQIRKHPGQGGRGQAITGLVLGGVSLVLIVVMLIAVGTAEFQFQTQTLLG